MLPGIIKTVYVFGPFLMNPDVFAGWPERKHLQAVGPVWSRQAGPAEGPRFLNLAKHDQLKNKPSPPFNFFNASLRLNCALSAIS